MDQPLDVPVADPEGFRSFRNGQQDASNGHQAIPWRSRVRATYKVQSRTSENGFTLRQASYSALSCARLCCSAGVASGSSS
jgi:hypothetical protein